MSYWKGRRTCILYRILTSLTFNRDGANLNSLRDVNPNALIEVSPEEV